MDTTAVPVAVITETATRLTSEENVGKQVEENGLCEHGKVTQENEEAFGGPRFFPPLYRQRYSAVAQILKERQVKSVVDIGCAECKILRYFQGTESITEVAGVDLDKNLLLGSQHMIKPLNMDYLHLRKNPLRMRLYHGSIAEYDSRMSKYEAVTMVEIIEHLTEDVLASMPGVVFGKIRPRLVIMTTPNADFNELFPNFTGTRHWDHKFEWTRKECQEWCGQVARRHGYTVEYRGVGSGPEGTEHLGHCSQMALFTRLEDGSARIGNSDGGHGTGQCGQESMEALKPVESIAYEMLVECEHPYNRNPLSPEQQLRLEANYYIRLLAGGAEEEEGDSVVVPLLKLMDFPKVKALCIDHNVLRQALLEDGHTLTEDQSGVLYRFPEEEDDDEDSDCYSSYGDEGERDDRNSVESGQFSDAAEDFFSPPTGGAAQ